MQPRTQTCHYRSHQPPPCFPWPCPPAQLTALLLTADTVPAPWHRGVVLQHVPRHTARNPDRRTHRREKPSPSGSSPAQVYGEFSSLPSRSPPSRCWRCPRAGPWCAAPRRATARPCCCCRAALRVLHPRCLLVEKI